MKKQNNKYDFKNIIIFILIAILLVVGLFYLSEISGDRSNDKTVKPSDHNSENNNNVSNSNPLINSGEEWESDEEAELENVSFTEFKKAVQDDETTLVMLGTETCMWCNYQKEVLRHVLYLYPDINLVYLDVSTLDNDGRDYLISLDSELESFGTPTFIAVKDKKAIKVDTNGARGVSEIESLLAEVGIIEKTVTVKNDNPLIDNGEEWESDEEAELEKVSFNEFKKAVQGDEITVVMLGTETCMWCNYQKEVLRHVLYLYPGINLVYLDVSTLNSKEQDYLIGLDSKLESFGTPTFIAVKNEKAIKVDTNGARGVSKIESMLKDMGAM